MSEEGGVQVDAFASPGAMLRSAREKRDLSQREVADLLHLMPGYPAIIERDDFHSLRHPAFARGYVKAYGKLVGVDEQRLLDAFDRLRADQVVPEPRTVHTRPLQLQRTGLAGVIGLVLLVLLVLAIWWWRADPVSSATAIEGTLSPTTLRDSNYFVAGDR